MRIVYRPIGTIDSPFRDVEGVPIQPTAAAGIRGSVEVLPELWARRTVRRASLFRGWYVSARIGRMRGGE